MTDTTLFVRRDVSEELMKQLDPFVNSFMSVEVIWDGVLIKHPDYELVLFTLQDANGFLTLGNSFNMRSGIDLTNFNLHIIDQAKRLRDTAFVMLNKINERKGNMPHSLRSFVESFRPMHISISVTKDVIQLKSTKCSVFMKYVPMSIPFFDSQFYPNRIEFDIVDSGAKEELQLYYQRILNSLK